MSYAWRIRSLRGVPVSGMSQCTKTCQFLLAQRLQGLTRFCADGAHVTVKSVTREDSQQVNRAMAFVCGRDPRVPWNENERTGTRLATLVPDDYAGAGILKQENFLSIVVLVKRDRLVGYQSLGKHKEIFRVAEVAIHFNCERNPSERAGSMYQLITFIFLQDHWGGGSCRFFFIRTLLLARMVFLTYRDTSSHYRSCYHQQRDFLLHIYLPLIGRGG